MNVTAVRLLGRGDLPRVIAIEAESNPVPWREGDFQPYLAGSAGMGAAALHSSPGPVETVPMPGAARPYPYGGGALKLAWVWADAEVRGFVCAATAADEVELHGIAVETAFRGRGIASALLESLLEWARPAGYRTLHLEVRAGNGPALGLYRRFGFAETGRRRAYYHDNGEDALLLSREI